MIHRLYTPRAPLDRLVKCLWYWEGTPHAHTQERLMPTGDAAIIFNLGDTPIRIYDWKDPSRYESLGQAVLSGPRSQPFVIDTEQQERVFGIQFHAGGTFPFFSMPSSELENVSLPLDCAWIDAAELRERLLRAACCFGSADELFRLTEELLLGRLLPAQILHPAVAFAAQRFTSQPHRATVASVLNEVGLSHRRFLTLFHEEVGLSPKAFSRVQRFQRVLRRVHRAREIVWTQIALDCGYYDQAHLIHDFQSFSGFTPSAYAARAGEHMNHVALT